MAWSRFLQDQVWVDKNRKIHDIATMDPYHRKNVINYLRRRADVFALGEYFRLALESLSDPGDEAFWAFETMLVRLDDGPVWMEETPIMKSLLAADQVFEDGLSTIDRIKRWFLDLPSVRQPSPSIYER